MLRPKHSSVCTVVNRMNRIKNLPRIIFTSNIVSLFPFFCDDDRLLLKAKGKFETSDTRKSITVATEKEGRKERTNERTSKTVYHDRNYQQ
jgi:hypothetical protein